MGRIGSFLVLERGSAGDALGMDRRHHPLTGTYLCEGLNSGDGTYLVFDGEGATPCIGSPASYPPGCIARMPTASMCYGADLTIPYVTYDGKGSIHFFSVPDAYTYQRISDIPTYINVNKP